MHYFTYAYCSRSDNSHFHVGKLTALDLANNSIGARGAFHVAEYIKKSKSLLWISLYMNDIGDEVGPPELNYLSCEVPKEVAFSTSFFSTPALP